MYKYYIPLQDETDVIDSIAGEEYNLPASEMPSTFTIENGGEEFYPDLVWECEDEVTGAVVNGVGVEPVELIGGVHSPQRPK